ncbi:MAG: lipocalin-like domain-containing protein [Acidobacteriia bacterium]|nr:lipocalin-like domain-containing protein [Terriglobia bacterium]
MTNFNVAASSRRGRGLIAVQVVAILAATVALSVVASHTMASRVHAAAQASVKERLVGTWKLVSRESRLATGEIIPDPALGAKPSGVLIYDAAGHVAAQLSRQGRTMDIFKDECAEITAVKTSPNTANTVFGYDAYFGTYTLHEAEGYVMHHLESALWPGNMGKDIKRSFTLQGDELTITFTTTQDGKAVLRTLVWHRWK